MSSAAVLACLTILALSWQLSVTHDRVLQCARQPQPEKLQPEYQEKQLVFSWLLGKDALTDPNLASLLPNTIIMRVGPGAKPADGVPVIYFPDFLVPTDDNNSDLAFLSGVWQTISTRTCRWPWFLVSQQPLLCPLPHQTLPFYTTAFKYIVVGNATRCSLRSSGPTENGEADRKHSLTFDRRPSAADKAKGKDESQALSLRKAPDSTNTITFWADTAARSLAVQWAGLGLRRSFTSSLPVSALDVFATSCFLLPQCDCKHLECQGLSLLPAMLGHAEFATPSRQVVTRKLHYTVFGGITCTITQEELASVTSPITGT
jgi:hypothetical protein